MKEIYLPQGFSCGDHLMWLPGSLLLVSGLGCQQGAPQHLLRLPQELHVLLDAAAAAAPEVQPEPVLLGV